MEDWELYSFCTCAITVLYFGQDMFTSFFIAVMRPGENKLPIHKVIFVSICLALDENVENGKVNGERDH